MTVSGVALSEQTQIGLEGVSFSYAGGDDARLILDDVSIQIPHGKITALMGASGGG